jgi:ferrous iron transport protein A
MPISVGDMCPGDAGTIVKVSASPHARRRLTEMGLVAGATVTLVRVAPLGDPLELRVGTASLALRRATAAAVLLEPGM